LGADLNFDIPLTSTILGSISRVDDLHKRWGFGSIVSDEKKFRLAESAQLQSVAAAARLSGMRRSDDQIAEILAGRLGTAAEQRLTRGYASGWQHRFASPNRPLGSTDLGRLNALVMDQPGGAAVSDWRREPLVREAFSAEGQATGRIYSTLPPRSIDSHMGSLIDQLNGELAHPARHPIPAIAMFVLGFLSASPFSAGNGRTACLAAGHLLRRAGYDHVGYSSLETQIEDLREPFQESFDASQTQFWSGGATTEPWLSLFVELLDRQRERLDVQLALEQQSDALPPLQAAILNVVREHGMVSAGVLIESTGANRNTLKDNLRRLVDGGELERLGERRAAKYRLAPPKAPDPTSNL
jgi:Fic family protein